MGIGFNFTGGAAGPIAGQSSSAALDASGWTVAAPRSIALGAGGLCPWVIVAAAVALFVLFKKKG